MEKDRGAVLATERYGSAESWKYFAKDGVMQRRRDGSEGASKGNSAIGVFKVRFNTFLCSHIDFHTLPPDLTFIFILFQSVFLPQGYPESVSDDYLQYQFWDTVQVQMQINTSLPSLSETVVLHSHTLLSLSGFLQLSVRDSRHAGLSQRSGCWKP